MVYNMESTNNMLKYFLCLLNDMMQMSEILLHNQDIPHFNLGLVACSKDFVVFLTSSKLTITMLKYPAASSHVIIYNHLVI
jgi:hypothetical protein